MSIADKPSNVHAAGIPVFSTKAFSSSSACASMTPCPKRMKGFFALSIGEIVDAIVTNDGDVNVGLAMVDINYQPEQPRQGGEPVGDTTTISLGRT